MSADLFREASPHLITSVALITSKGKGRANVMSAEWTFQVSYRPMMLIVLVDRGDATHDNILESKEFGVNFLGDDQASLSSLAGAYTGKEVNKLSSDIFQTYSGKKIQTPMISGCFLNAECQLKQVIETGDHTMFLGEVLDVHFDESKSPLLYTKRRYWQRGPQLQRKASIYTTHTVGSDFLRVDGRLQGVEKYPQTVDLALSSNRGGSVVREAVETDENGYFELVKPNSFEGKVVYTVRAEWKGLTAAAATELG